MKIELKNIKIAEHMSEETTAFTADIFVDGVKTGYAKNHGHGGCTDYNRYPGKKYSSGGFDFDTNQEALKKAEAYCLTLPPIKYPAHGSMKAFEVPMNLENFIDDLVEAEVKRKGNAKFKKTLEKKQVNTIMWGVPNGSSYTQVSFKVPLAKIPALQLQVFINKYKKEFKEGQVFLNTNLEVLGIKL